MRNRKTIQKWEFFYVLHTEEVIIMGTQTCKVPSRTNKFKILTVKANNDETVKQWGYRIVEEKQG